MTRGNIFPIMFIYFLIFLYHQVLLNMIEMSKIQIN